MCAGGHTRCPYSHPIMPASETVVMKFGGTSVAEPDDIRRAARRIVAARQEGKHVVAVLSARGKTTDDLVSMAYEVSETPAAREMDMLLSTGERISCALCAMAIHDLGYNAISLTGSQAGIVTDSSHTKARILDVRADRIRSALDEDRIVLVAGFQGVSGDSRDVTTLGRGGSDTTAVALAAALSAASCEIYTDVTGVFSADPRIVPTARRLSHLSYEEMLEIAATGGRVLALRSVEFARNHQVPLHVRSSFTWEPGTWVTEEAPTVEDPIISGITHDMTEAKVTVRSVPDRPGVSATLFEPLAEANVNVDMIVQNISHDGLTDISFTMPKSDMAVAERIVADVADKIGAGEANHDADIAKVSLVGAGMKTSPGVAAKMFRVLADAGVNIQMISTSTIRISCVVAAVDMERAVRALHTAFGLDGDVYRAPLPERR